MYSRVSGFGAIGASEEKVIRYPGNEMLYFDFSEGNGTTVYDKSGNNNNGTFGAGAAAPTWKRNSLYFDGGNHVLLTGLNHGITTGEFTFCFYVSGWSSKSYLFDQETKRALFYQGVDTKVSFYTVSFKLVSDTGIDSIKPLSIQVTRDKSANLEAYINGSSENKGLSESGDIAYDGGSVVTMGSRYTFANALVGTMYSFRILNKCLSGIEAQREYLAQKFAANN